jgi:hypothetical protein
MERISATGLIFLLSSACAHKSPKSGMEAGLVDPDGLFVRSLELSGGAAQISAVNRYAMQMQVRMPAQGIEFSANFDAEAPSNYRMTAEVPGIGRIAEGFHEGVAWEINPLTGPRLKSQAEALQAKLSNDLHRFVDWEEHWPQRRYGGLTQHAGMICHVVDAVDASGRTTRLFFEAETGIYRGELQDLETDMGILPTRTEVLDYSAICGGLPTPVLTRISIGPMSQEVEIRSCEVNGPEKDLHPPPDILALRLLPASPIMPPPK